MKKLILFLVFAGTLFLLSNLSATPVQARCVYFTSCCYKSIDCYDWITSQCDYSCSAPGPHGDGCCGYEQCWTGSDCCNENAWSSWSSCTVACGGGTQYRTSGCWGWRGQYYSSDIQYQSCNTATSRSCTATFGTCSATGTQACVNNNWSSTCSATDPRATCASTNNCGATCGTATCSDGCGGTLTCNTGACCSDGSFTRNCTSWSACSASCGWGTQTRTCYDNCGTAKSFSQSCQVNDPNVIVSCGSWGTCSNTCGQAGSQSRTCTNQCGGTVTQTQSCTDTSGTAVTSCGSWSTCSNTCGGTGSQSRTCNTASCGTVTQTQSCSGNTSSIGTVNTATCGAWSTCSSTCGGTGSQSRTCQDVCGYSVTQTQSCTDTSGTAVTSCGSWSTCSNTCGGTGSQSRTCNTASCGTVTQTQSCTDTSKVGVVVNTSTCGSWGACDTKCGTGNQSRTCQDVCGYSVTQTQSCTDTSNVGVLDPSTCSAWSACSGTACGPGTQSRTCRDFCNNPVPDQTQSCTVSGQRTVSGGISNATQAVSVCATKTGGGSCPSPVCSPASQTSYSLTLNSGCNYELSASPISGLTVEPDDYQISTGCSNINGPQFWYLSGAGVVSAGTTINAGSGYISQAGTPPPPAGPGLNLQNYNSQTPLSKVNYSEFLKAVLKNAKTAAATIEAQANCTAGSGVAYSTTSFDFYCYVGTGGNFNSQLSTALSSGSTSKTLVLYPLTGSAQGQQTISSAQTVNNRRVVVFVNGNLGVQANVAVTANSSSGIVFILNAYDAFNPGSLLVDAAVTVLDGVYVAPGGFNDTYNGANIGLQLLGKGMILSTGTQPLVLGRAYPYTSGPAESWTYQGKYLSLFKNVLVVPRYTWQELPPN